MELLILGGTIFLGRHLVEAALANGADYLVIGRPITRASDPVAALGAINRSLGGSR